MKSFVGEPDYRFKVVVIGSSGSGKTAIVDRLLSDTFSSSTKVTVGVDYRPYRIDVKQNVVQLELWDTAGQERYKAIAKSYFRNSVGCVLVFDTTSQASFDDVQFWLSEFRMLADPNAFILMVGNKIDLENERQIRCDTAEIFAKDHLLEYLETSAVTSHNIKETFQRLATSVFDLVQNGKIRQYRSGEDPKRVKREEIIDANVRDELSKHGFGCC
jgi:small GTP-binding protein